MFHYRIMLIIALTGTLAVPALANMTLLDDFSSYSDGQSLKGAGNGLVSWDNTPNTNWMPQNYDPENLIVKSNPAGGKYLAVSNQDVTAFGGDLQLGVATGAAMKLPTITDKGTIYMKLKIDDIMNVAIATNGVPKSTFCDASIGELECQAVHGWAEQSSIIRFRNGVLTGPEYPFDARDGDKYVQSPFNTFNSDTWYEMWIQLDVPNLNARYYLRELGDSATPVAMLDETGSSDWGFRELFRFQITTLKFNIEASPDYTCDNSSGGNCQYAEMLIDDIGIDQSGWSLQSVPEPTTLGLLVVGSLMMIRRR